MYPFASKVKLPPTSFIKFNNTGCFTEEGSTHCLMISVSRILL